MKKISVILAVLMLVSTLALSAFAAGNATFTVGSAACKPGDTVTVPVVLKNSPGIVGAQLDLTFDPSRPTRRRTTALSMHPTTQRRLPVHPRSRLSWRTSR